MGHISGHISDEDIDRVRSAIDIVETIGAYVPLKRSGRSFQGLCPFHGDTEPSFHVFPESQLYKCFGCQKSGTVFSFLMEYNRMEFPDAVKELANRAGIALENDSPPEQVQKKNKLYSALHMAVIYYHRNLIESKETSAEKAMQYLNKKNISKETITENKIGFAPESWDFMLNILKDQFDPAILHEAGIISTSNRGTNYDFFRNRIIFPIYDARERVIAVGGRTIAENYSQQKIPKFLNSRESMIFSKEKTLYLIDRATKNRHERKPMLVVEGYTDGLVLQQEGFVNTVATAGTALTLEHMLLLKKYTDEIIMCFDSDRAGIDAVINSAELPSRAGLSFKVISLPTGMDPDEFIMKRGKEEFQNKINQAQNIFEFALENLVNTTKINNIDDKIKFLKQISPLLNNTPDSVRCAAYCDKLANVLNMNYDAIASLIESNKTGKKEQITLSPLSTEELEYQIIGNSIQSPELIELFSRHLNPEQFQNNEYRLIYSYFTSGHAKQYLRNHNPGIVKELSLFAEIYTEDIPKDITAFAQKKKISIDEANIRKIISRLLRTSLVKTNVIDLINRFKEEVLASETEKNYNNDDAEQIKQTLENFLE